MNVGWKCVKFRNTNFQGGPKPKNLRMAMENNLKFVAVLYESDGSMQRGPPKLFINHEKY